MVDVKANNLFFVIMFWLGKYKMYTDNSRKEVEWIFISGSVKKLHAIKAKHIRNSFHLLTKNPYRFQNAMAFW